VVYGFRCAWRTHIVTGETLYVAPEGKKPSFELVLRCVRKEVFVRPYPRPYLLLGITGVNEIAPAGIHIGQGDDGIGGSQ